MIRCLGTCHNVSMQDGEAVDTHTLALAPNVRRHSCCDSLLICEAVVALDTRRDGLKAKRDGVDVEDDEGSV